MINGASTWAESQGNRIPPNVRPVIAMVAPATMIKLPLQTVMSIEQIKSALYI